MATYWLKKDVLRVAKNAQRVREYAFSAEGLHKYADAMVLHQEKTFTGAVLQATKEQASVVKQMGRAANEEERMTRGYNALVDVGPQVVTKAQGDIAKTEAVSRQEKIARTARKELEKLAKGTTGARPGPAVENVDETNLNSLGVPVPPGFTSRKDYTAAAQAAKKPEEW